MSHINNKRKLILSSVSVDIGCSCRKPSKLFSFLKPKPSYNSTTTTTTSSSSSLYRRGGNGNGTSSDDSSASYYSLRHLLDAESSLKAPHKPVKGFGRIDDEGIAVEKDSDDPYLDFRHSMLQMILENGIYSKEDMRELLNCFLQLNSPYYHGVIVRAFTEIWNGVFSVRSPSVVAPVDHCYRPSPSPLAGDNYINRYGYYYKSTSWEC